MTKKKKSTTTKHKGIALRVFGFDGKRYQRGDTVLLSSKKDYDNFINLKYIK